MVVLGNFRDHILESGVASLVVDPLDTLGREDGKPGRRAYVLLVERIHNKSASMYDFTNISGFSLVICHQGAHHLGQSLDFLLALEAAWRGNWFLFILLCPILVLVLLFLLLPVQTRRCDGASGGSCSVAF